MCVPSARRVHGHEVAALGPGAPLSPAAPARTLRDPSHRPLPGRRPRRARRRARASLRATVVRFAVLAVLAVTLAAERPRPPRDGGCRPGPGPRWCPAYSGYALRATGRVSPICGAGRVSPILGLEDEGRGWMDSSLTTGTPCVLREVDAAHSRRAKSRVGEIPASTEVKKAKDCWVETRRTATIPSSCSAMAIATSCPQYCA